MARYLYSALASAIQARKNCQERNNQAIGQIGPSCSAVEPHTRSNKNDAQGEDMTPDKQIVTPANIDALKQELPRDQGNELVVGCETWGIFYAGGQRGQMTVWPEQGRAAVMFGADSIWGDWDGTALRADDGISYDASGDYALSQEITDEQILDSRKGGN